MSLPFSYQDISEQINHDIHTCTTLLSLLKQEREALKSRNVDTLEALLTQKADALLSLDNSAKKRTQWAQKANITPSNHGWKQLLSALNKPDIVVNWAQLKSLTLECKKSNEINGKLLSRNKKTLSRLLDVMRGKSENTTLYNAYGSSSANNSSIKVGEA